MILSLAIDICGHFPKKSSKEKLERKARKRRLFEKTNPIRKENVEGATLIGSGSDVIKNISMVGNDLELDNGFGMCGKSGQTVQVGLGIPSCKVLMTVGGSKV